MADFLSNPEVIEQENFIREDGDYMKRQPRVDLKKSGNYNFEQFRRFTEVYETAKEKDDKKSAEFYRLTKYVKDNMDNEKDVLVNMFTSEGGKGLRPELIEVPAEFENLSTENMSELYTQNRETGGRGRRKIVRNRTDKSLYGYDAWRSIDRTFLRADDKHPPVCKLMIAPALLLRTFGWPSDSQSFYTGTGIYNFEDTNLNLFQLFDYKQTDYYHGINREDDHYTSPKNMRKPLHKRKRKWPTVEEFWNSEEPM